MPQNKASPNSRNAVLKKKAQYHTHGTVFHHVTATKSTQQRTGPAEY